MLSTERWKSWGPPGGWRTVPSAVDGFALWAPPDGPGDTGPRPVRCPRCGASARFDPARGRLGCGLCDWSAAEAPAAGVEPGRGFTEAALLEGEEGFGVDRRVLSCQSCGAEMLLEPGALSATCTLCASPQVSIREQPGARGIRPVALLPFAVGDEACRQHAAKWLGGGWFHPRDLSRIARVDRFKGVYVPYWVFTAAVDAEWKAKVGHERVERVFDPRTNQWETRVEIDWRWQSGRVRLPATDLFVPGTTRLSARLLGQLSAGRSMAEAKAYEPSLLASFQAHTYDVSLAAAWDEGRSVYRERAREACRRDIPTAHVRELSVVADLEEEVWRHVLVPVWVSAYRYANRTWVVLCDGRSGEVVGSKPVDWRKVKFVLALLLGPGVALTLLGIPLLFVAVGAPVILFGLVLLVLGAVPSGLLWSWALSSEAA